MAKAAIALGSNLDQPAQQLTLAVAALAELPHTVVGAVSRFYRTAPVGYADQPDFVNAAAWVETQLSAEAFRRFVNHRTTLWPCAYLCECAEGARFRFAVV